jgi:hypothetical protein
MWALSSACANPATAICAGFFRDATEIAFGMEFIVNNNLSSWISQIIRGMPCLWLSKVSSQRIRSKMVSIRSANSANLVASPLMYFASARTTLAVTCNSLSSDFDTRSEPLRRSASNRAVLSISPRDSRSTVLLVWRGIRNRLIAARSSSPTTSIFFIVILNASTTSAAIYEPATIK